MNEHHQHGPGITQGGAPFLVESVACGNGQVMVDYLSEDPVHRHFSMIYMLDESPTICDLVQQLGDALVAAAQKSMIDMLGDTTVPDMFDEPLVMWYCRICMVTAPADTPGWTTRDEGKRQYCPDHIPANA